MEECIVQTPEQADAEEPLHTEDQYPVPGYPLTVSDPEWAEQVADMLADADVPWGELEAARKSWQHWPIPVIITMDIRGLGQANDYGRIKLRPRGRSTRETLLHELGHVYDFFCVTDQSFRRDRSSSDEHLHLKRDASRVPLDGEHHWWSFQVGWANRWHEGFAEAVKHLWGGEAPRAIMTARWDDIGAIIGEVDVARIAGETRYDTAVEVSKTAFPDGARNVALFRGEEPLYDAMAASMLAANGWAVLPTDPDRLPDVIAEEIRRLRPSTVRVLGGRFAVSDAVVRALQS